MHRYVKFGASLMALCAAMSLAQAETERQGPEKGAAEGERGKGDAGAPASKQKQSAEPARTAKPGESESQTRVNRTAKTGADEGDAQRKGGSNDQGIEERQRQSNAAGTAGRKVKIAVTGVQKSKLHDALIRDTALRRYHGADFHFAVEVGARLPEDIVFYDPPEQFIDVDPEFRGYKIVVLDDEILIIDPDTREIVDVIPT
jgi:hypothetical protein